MSSETGSRVDLILIPVFPSLEQDFVSDFRVGLTGSALEPGACGQFQVIVVPSVSFNFD